MQDETIMITAHTTDTQLDGMPVAQLRAALVAAVGPTAATWPVAILAGRGRDVRDTLVDQQEELLAGAPAYVREAFTRLSRVFGGATVAPNPFGWRVTAYIMIGGGAHPICTAQLIETGARWVVAGVTHEEITRLALAAIKGDDRD